MKRILLTSTALVAFAGAAAAEVSFSSTAKVGYNDKFDNGAYWSAGVAIKGSKELDGGLTAGFGATVNIGAGKSAFTLVNPATKGLAKDQNVYLSDYELFLKSDTAGMYVGDTKTATEAKWSAGVTGLKLGFAKKGKSGEAAIIRGEGTIAGFDAAISAGIHPAVAPATGTEVKAYQLAAKYTMGDYNFGFAYQDKDNTGGAQVGVRAGATVAGADVAVAYINNTTNKTNSYGIQVAYPFGPVKATGYFAKNSSAADRYGIKLAYAADAIKVTAAVDGYAKYMGAAAYNTIAVDGSYDMGNGLTIKAGAKTDTKKAATRSAYIGGEYNMGGGATLLASYGWDNKAGAATKEIGAPKWKEGVTAEISFKF